MSNFIRKLKRRQLVTARKKFMKDFKASMSKFKKQVICTSCSRPPHPGENIDNWRINKSSENIDLICTECYDEIGVEDE
tara:strand:- start:2261 stop:2497 length:237 start_codon:yes stop_codon:yes gene_type:complete